MNHFAAPSGTGRIGGDYSSPVIRTGAAAYPREAIDSDAFAVRIANPARRIVSQYWSIDEFAYSVVPPDRVIAVSENSYVERVSNVYDLVQRYRPAIATDPERILRLDPDLVMVSNTSRADFCAIVRAAQVPIYRTFTALTTLAQIPETLRLTGYLTGEDQAASDQIGLFWNEVNRAKARRPSNAPHPRILGYSGGYGYGRGTFFDDIVHTLGGINVASNFQGYGQVNSEQIVHWNPEWIITGADKGEPSRCSRA